MKPHSGVLWGVAVCAALASRAAFSATFLVAPAGTDSGTCNPIACATVGYALTQAAAGDTISLAAGTYSENVLVDKAVTIAGAGQASTTIVPAASQPTCTSGTGSLCGALANASNVIVVQASGVTIHDLTVDGDNPALTSAVNVAGANIDARNGIIENHLLATPYDGTTVHHVTVKNIYLRGIYASSGGSGFSFHDDIVDNVQADPASIAIFASGASGVVQSCTVSRAGDGISANWSRGIQFLSNSVTTSGSGVHTDNNGGSGGVADLISGNTVTNGTVGAYGVWVFATYRATTVQNNTVTNVDVGLAAAGSNAPTGAPIFVGNTVTGTNAPNGAGFYVTTDQFGWGSNNVQVTITGNTFTNTTDGLYLEAQTVSAVTYTATVTATGNTITGATGSGVLFATPVVGTGTYAATLHLNRIAGNGTGLSNPIAGNSVVANRNWWGCNSGPGSVTALGTCNAVTGAGTTTITPVLVLGVTALPVNPVQGTPSAVTADLAHDDAAAAAAPGVPDATPVSWSTTLAGSTMTPPAGVTALGTASSVLNSSGAGSTNACATVDFEKQCATVLYATPVELLRFGAD